MQEDNKKNTEDLDDDDLLEDGDDFDFDDIEDESGDDGADESDIDLGDDSWDDFDDTPDAEVVENKSPEKKAKKNTKAAPAEKPAAEKKAPAKKAAAPKKTKKMSYTPEDRYRMVQTAAYFIAERNGFQGCSSEHWAAAEIEISRMLGE